MAQHAAPGPASVVKMRPVRHLNRHLNQRDGRRRPVIPLVHVDDPDTFVTVHYTGRHRRQAR